MVAVRLPIEIEGRLSTLAQKTGRTKSFYIREALERHLEDMEDAYLAEERYRTMKDTISLDDLIHEPVVR